MPLPGVSVAPEALTSIEAESNQDAEPPARDGSDGAVRSIRTSAWAHSETLPAASCDRNRTSVSPSSETVADAAGASADQVEPPSVEVSTVTGSAASPEPPASDSGPEVTSTDATFCHRGDPPDRTGVSGAV